MSRGFVFAPGDELIVDEAVRRGAYISNYGPSMRFEAVQMVHGRVLVLIEDIKNLLVLVNAGMQGIAEDTRFTMLVERSDKYNSDWYKTELLKRWGKFSLDTEAFLRSCLDILRNKPRIEETDMRRLLSTCMYLETRQVTLRLNGYLPKSKIINHVT